jgi:predicted HicB family RNase H-like nuclease
MPPKRSEHKAFLLRLDPDLHRWLRFYAVDRGEPLNTIINEILADFRQADRRRVQYPEHPAVPRTKRK